MDAWREARCMSSDSRSRRLISADARLYVFMAVGETFSLGERDPSTPVVRTDIGVM